MKKWLLAGSLVVLTLLLCSYLIIPGTFLLEEKERAAVHPRSFQRTIVEEAQWTRWWPGTVQDSSGVTRLTYNGFRYTLADRQLTSLTFSISDGDFSLNALLHCIPVSADTMEFHWVARKPLSAEPLRRWQAYRKAKQLDKDLQQVLRALTAFYANPDNIYGRHIKKARVVDSILLSTSAISNGYPQTGFVYRLVDQLKEYIATQGARPTGYPMLNISTKDSTDYLVKVAIPVNRTLPPSGKMASRWMLGGGNILITEVRGGPISIRAAYQQVEQYISDFQRIPPAIPFESLVTDRRTVPDTSQWVTRICYPVM